MDNWIIQLGVGGIFAVLIIREFVNLLAKMKGNDSKPTGTNPQICQDIKSITIDTNDKVKEIHSIQSQKDADGLPLSYFPRSIAKSQEKIAKDQAVTAQHMKTIADAVTELKKERSHNG